MRNFMVGLMLGWLASYFYFTQTDYARAVINDLWTRVSAAPALGRQAR